MATILAGVPSRTSKVRTSNPGERQSVVSAMKIAKVGDHIQSSLSKSNLKILASMGGMFMDKKFTVINTEIGTCVVRVS